MAYRIDQTTVRDKLVPRIGQPYWDVPRELGRALCYRKIDG
jgi:hypothetical protein